MPELLNLALETKEQSYDKRMKRLSLKLETVKMMKSFAFLKPGMFEIMLKEIEVEVENWQKTSSTACRRTLSNRRLKGLEKRIHNIIETGLQNTNCNLFLTNIPAQASLQDSSVVEYVSPEHIFDTLVHFGGTPNYVLQVGPDSFISDLPSLEKAQEMKNKLHGMFMNGNTIRVYTLTKFSPGPLDVVPSGPLKLEEKRSDFFERGFIITLIFLIFSSAFMVVYMSFVQLFD